MPNPLQVVRNIIRMEGAGREAQGGTNMLII